MSHRRKRRDSEAFMLVCGRDSAHNAGQGLASGLKTAANGLSAAAKLVLIAFGRVICGEGRVCAASAG